jgi:WD40 repeat protein
MEMFHSSCFGWLRAALIVTCVFSFLPIGSTPAMADDEIPIAELEREEPVDFEKEILPIFRSNCLACHNSGTAESDLILETPASILEGGFEGPGVDLEDVDESLILQLAARQRESFMPPDGNDVGAKNLTSEELGLIKLWIQQGAEGTVTGKVAEIQWQPLPPGVNPIYSVSVTQDGQFVAAGRANQIFLYHLPSRRELGRLTDPALLESGIYSQPGVADLDLIQSLAFSPDGQRLVSGGFRTAKIWRRQSDVPVAELTGLEEAARVIALGPNGETIAWGDEKGIVRLVDRASGEVKARLEGHSAAITGLAFSADGEKIYTSSLDQTWRVWNGDGTAIASVETATPLNALALVDDGRRLVVGGEDQQLHLWPVPEGDDAPAGEPAQTLSGHSQGVTSLATLADGQFLSASLDGMVRLWQSRDGEQLREVNHEGPVTAVAVSSDGTRFASVSPEHRSVKIWNLADGKLEHELRGDHRVQYREAADTRQVALAQRLIELAQEDLKAATDRKTAEEGNVTKAEEERTKADEELAEKAKEADEKVAEKEEAEKAAETAKTEIAKLEEMKKKTEEALAAARQSAQEAEAKRKSAEEALAKAAEIAQAEEAKAVEMEAEQKKVADGLAAVMDQLKEAEEKAKNLAEPAEKALEAKTAAERAAETAQRAAERAKMTLNRVAEEIPPLETAVEQRTSEHQETEEQLASTKEKVAASEIAYQRVVFSPDNATLAAAGDDGVVRLFDVPSGTPLNEVTVAPQGSIPFVITPENQLLAAAEAGIARAWSVAPRWELERTLGSPDSTEIFVDRVTAVKVSPDNRLLATGTGEPSRSGELALWDLDSGEPVWRLPDAHSDTVFAVDFSRDGRLLVSSAADRFVKIFQVEDGEFVRAFEGHTHHVLGVAWSADGRLLSSSGADNVVKIWNALTGDQQRTIQGFNKEVTAVRFRGDSDQVIASSGDATLQLKRSDNGGNIRSFAGATDFLYSVDVTADGNTIVAGGQDSMLRVWTEDGTNVAEFPPPAPPE